MVIKFFFKYSMLSNSGMAVICNYFWLPFWPAPVQHHFGSNALTIWIAPFSLIKGASYRLPSIAIISPSVISWHSCIHSINIFFQRPNCSMLLTTRAMVSSTGMPLSKSPYFFTAHSSLSCPKSSISCHSSAPAITAHTVRNKIADNLCLTFPCCRI